MFVPGLSQLLVVHAVGAVGAVGASRAGILFGMAPLFSALIAIVAFGEPLRWPLAAGTLLIVAGGITLAWRGARPIDYRPYGAALAVIVAAAFGIRDNVARTVGEDVAAEPLAQATALMLGASMLLVFNLLRRRNGIAPRLRAAILPFAASGIVTAVGQATLFEALDRRASRSSRRSRERACSGRWSSPRCSSGAPSWSAGASWSLRCWWSLVARWSAQRADADRVAGRVCYRKRIDDSGRQGAAERRSSVSAALHEKPPLPCGRRCAGRSTRKIPTAGRGRA